VIIHKTVKNKIQGVSKKVASPKTFKNIFTSVKSFCVKFYIFFGNSYPIISTNFCKFILIFHQMALIFPRVAIVFTLSSFEYSLIKWKCHGRSPTVWFTQNGWASAVDSTADFLNSAQLLSFVCCHGNWKMEIIDFPPSIYSRNVFMRSLLLQDNFPIGWLD